MTTPSGRTPRGRRDNGLDAAEYAAAADVDPRVGEHLLDVLGLAGIAAYLQPSADLHPVTRTTTLPDRPTDRLFVDRRHLAEARDVIGRLDLGTGDLGTGDLGTGAEAGSGTAEAASPTDRPGAPPLRRRREDVDVDAAWRDILESWAAPAVEPPAPGFRRGPGTAEPGTAEPGTGAPGTESTGAARPAGEAPAGETTTDRTRTDQTRTDQPRTEDHTVDRPRADENRTDDGPARHEPAPPRDERRHVPRDAVPRPITGLDVPFDPDERVEDPDDEGFVPPAPPPVPRASRYTVLAVALVLGGLALFLWPALLPIGESTSLVLGVSGILGGFATLVWRLRDGLTDDDDGDDGAIV